MIRYPDLLRVSLKKTFTRVRWTLLTMLSLSLGLVVFIASSSLLGGIRELFVRTMLYEVIQDSPRVIVLKNEDPDKPRTEGVPERRILESDLATIRKLPGVEDAAPEARVWPVTIEGIRLETYEGVSSLIGITRPFMRLHVSPGVDLDSTDDVVPVIIGRYAVRSRYDADHQRFQLDSSIDETALIGLEIHLKVGDNETYSRPYNRVWKDDSYVIKIRNPEEIEELKRQREAHLAARYELNLHQRALKLKARIVGISPGHECYIPYDVATQCDRWIELRNQLALLKPGAEDVNEPDPPGWEEVRVLVQEGADPQSLVAPLRKLGFHPQTREDRINEGMEQFDKGTEVIWYILAGLGILIMLTSCLFVFITTSKVIADSQAEIGLLRALGATRLEIMRLFLLKCGFLGFGGSFSGSSAAMDSLTAFLGSRWNGHGRQASSGGPGPSASRWETSSRNPCSTRIHGWGSQRLRRRCWPDSLLAGSRPGERPTWTRSPPFATNEGAGSFDRNIFVLGHVRDRRGDPESTRAADESGR